ncbi:MAG: isoaspartyl peptidase/L-asparaginase, partial [Myxococcota bacterium]|nr:isoaspartyl peptidase/L-asparaginase [Myxococcota bacterium]
MRHVLTADHPARTPRLCGMALVFGMLVGCGERNAATIQPALTVTNPQPPWQAAALAHGGVGSPPERSDGCRAAVDRALDVLAETGSPLEAAVAGIQVLEDDARFNAGTGSRLRIDGHTIQMDAAVMDSTGRFGAVAVVENVRNPVLVARGVADTPHLLLAGDGATRFARTLGLAPYDPTTDTVREKTMALREKLQSDDPGLPEAWKEFDWRTHWNFDQ